MDKVINFIKRTSYRIWGIPIRIHTFKNWPIWLQERFNIFCKRKKNNEFIAQLRNGVKFYFKSRQGEFEPIYEIWRQNIYTKHYQIKDRDIIIDIGANIGVFSIFVAKSAMEVKVFSYEPTPEVFKRLLKNIKINNLENFIFPFQLGVAGNNGEKILFIHPKGSTSNTLYRDYLSVCKNNSLPIRTVTLEDIFRNNNLNYCDFLKIDAEGAEYEILFHTSPEYLRKIKNIALEYHQGHREIIKFLEKLNFQTQYESYRKSKISGRIWAKHD